MSKIAITTTLALAISIGGTFWGNGASASSPGTQLLTDRWMWSAAAFAGGSSNGKTSQTETADNHAEEISNEESQSK